MTRAFWPHETIVIARRKGRRHDEKTHRKTQHADLQPFTKHAHFGRICNAIEVDGNEMLKRANIVNIVYVVLSSSARHAMPIPSHPQEGARQAIRDSPTTAGRPGRRHAASALRPGRGRDKAAPLPSKSTHDHAPRRSSGHHTAPLLTKDHTRVPTTDVPSAFAGSTGHRAGWFGRAKSEKL